MLPNEHSQAAPSGSSQGWSILLLMVLDAPALAALLQTLPPLQEKVVRLFYGFGCRRSHSACEIAREFAVSPQVIGGVLAAAERKLAQAGLTREELREAARLERQTIALRRRKCRCRS